MSVVADLPARLAFWRKVDRIGPDIPLTHWRLHFPSSMRRLCRAKFLRFGDGAEFRPGAYAVTCSKIEIGERVVVRPGCMLFAHPEGHDGKIIIEDDVLMGGAVHIYTSNHQFDDRNRPIIDQGHREPRDVVIRRGAWIGANAVLLCGVEVGANAVVGAGSVVTRSVLAGTVAAGNPARPIASTKSDMRE